MYNSILKEDFMIIPGVFNPFSALLSERVGFKSVYLSGAALTASYGIPDIGLITLDEVAGMVRKIREVTEIPIIVDADTGFGEPVNVYRTVRMLEDAGATAIQIEDQRLPKKCGHLNGKEIVDRDEMITKIHTALKARKDLNIVARTDSRAVYGMEEAIERCNIYKEEGADIIFPEALESEEEFKTVHSKVKAPLLANMTEFGKTPYISSEQFKNMGYKYVIYPVTIFRIAGKAMKVALERLIKEGSQQNMVNDMMTRKELYSIINYDFYDKMDKELSSK